MRRKCMKNGAWIAGLGVLIALAVAAWADVAPPVEGDLQAWAEIVAAFKKLTELSGYRIKFVSSTGPTGVIEAVPRSNTSYTCRQSALPAFASTCGARTSIHASRPPMLREGTPTPVQESCDW